MTYELETAADGGLNVGAAEGGDLTELTGDLDGVVEEEPQATLITEARRAGNLSKQDCGARNGGRQRGMAGVGDRAGARFNLLLVAWTFDEPAVRTAL